jgi:hypothetical protein
MKTIEDTIVVFTGRSPATIIAERGSKAWVLDAVRARRCTWLLCTQNRFSPKDVFNDATEPHHTAFLLGRISSVRPSEEPGDEGRWTIEISDYKRVNIAEAWPHGARNPVRYESLSKFKIDPTGMIALTISPEPPPHAGRPSPALAPAAPSGVLTIAEAKKQLAAAFGIKPDAIEITIRG